MKLVESVDWSEKIPLDPPVKLNYSTVIIPSELDYTFIATRHDIDGGEPDYLSEVFSSTDVVLYEGVNWDKPLLRRMQGIANGGEFELREALQENANSKQVTSGIAAWRSFVYKQLYCSGVRIKIPDYPKGHPAIPAYMRAVFGKGHKTLTEQQAQAYAARDKYIVEATAHNIQDLRNVKTIREKSPLRVVALFGAAHVAVYHAIAAAAEEQDTASFSSRLLFEEGAAFDSSQVVDVVELKETQEHLVQYHNWLRSKELLAT